MMTRNDIVILQKTGSARAFRPSHLLLSLLKINKKIIFYLKKKKKENARAERPSRSQVFAGL
jgi:hypothetical protein